MALTKLKLSSLDYNWCTRTGSTVRIICAGDQDISVPVSLVTALSPMIKEIYTDVCSCIELSIIIPDIDHDSLSQLLELVTEGASVGSLRSCTKVIDVLKVLGIEYPSILLQSVNTELENENREEVNVKMEVGNDEFDTYPSDDVFTVRSQSEELNYQCLICNFMTNRSKTYIDHVSVKDHPSRGELNSKPFICKVCQIRSNRRLDIVKHIETTKHKKNISD